MPPLTAEATATDQLQFSGQDFTVNFPDNRGSHPDIDKGFERVIGVNQMDNSTARRGGRSTGLRDCKSRGA